MTVKNRYIVELINNRYCFFDSNDLIYTIKQGPSTHTVWVRDVRTLLGPGFIMYST